MAQGGFTPIQLYYSTTGAAVPSAGNLANGELAINILDGKLYYKNNAGTVTLLAGATAGPAAGSTTQVQFNSSGVLAGSSALTFSGSTLSSTISSVGTSTASFANSTSLVWNNTTTINLNVQKSINSAFGPTLFMLKSRGTAPATNVSVVNNDSLGQLLFYGDDGTSTPRVGASINVNADGAPASSTIPGRIVFNTTTSGSSILERMRISSTGDTTFQPNGTNIVATVSSTGLAVAGVLTTTGTISPQQATTAGAPAYVLGAMYFDTTLNKLRIGGATGWETVTSV